MTTYKLVSENLTGLGGPMGTEHTSENFVRYFDGITKAKDAAVKDYGHPIKWERSGKRHSSGDLMHVMYDISPVKVE